MSIRQPKQIRTVHNKLVSLLKYESVWLENNNNKIGGPLD